MTSTASEHAETAEPVFARLEGQISWYDMKAGRNQRTYRYSAVTQIAISAIVVIVAPIPAPGVFVGPVSVAAALAAILAVVKGTETAYQWQANWVNDRAAAEALKREKYLYYGKAGPYTDAPDAQRVLAERVEDIIAHETGGWTSRSQSNKTGIETATG